MNMYIVTGASKGIGFELLKQLSAKGHFVIGIARTASVLDGVKFIEADLTNTDTLESLMDEILFAAPKKTTSFTLINNAGTVEPIGLIGTVNAENMTNAMALNLTAPLILSNAFIKKLRDCEGLKRIINISSGAGRNAYEGWGTYCTTKAGLDQFSRVVSLEQENAAFPVGIVSIAPGIIDTDMQETIRESKEEAFPLLGRFIDYKEKGLLSSAEQTATRLIKFMENVDLSTIDPIADLRDY